MKVAISSFALLMVWMMHRGWRPQAPPGAGALIATGAVAGLAQGAAAIGGPSAVAVALARPGAVETQRANVIGTVTTLAICGFPALWYHGLLTTQVLTLGALFIPLYWAAAWAGDRFFDARGRDHYRKAALLALAVVGMVTLALAVGDLPGG
ncbi:MAG: hypothetical protein OXR84_10550 [Magnetovibrio sp.]|nr:hypothetical protein [Magnetovibrio sp.]